MMLSCTALAFQTFRSLRLYTEKCDVIVCECEPALLTAASRPVARSP